MTRVLSDHSDIFESLTGDKSRIVGRHDDLCITLTESIENRGKVTGLRWMLIEFGFLTGENEGRPGNIIGPCQFLQQRKQIGSLEPMTEPRKLTLEFALAGKNVRQWLLDTHGLLRILFPMKS